MDDDSSVFSTVQFHIGKQVTINGTISYEEIQMRFNMDLGCVWKCTRDIHCVAENCSVLG